MLIELKEDDVKNINGGGVAGFVVGYMLGAVAGYVALPIMSACGGTQEESAQVFLSCIAIGAAIGSVCTGPA